MIYAFLNQKGGMGKTTLSLHVAGALARSQKRVLLVDADPQQSAMKWPAVRSGEIAFSVIGMAKATLHKEIVSLSADYDHLLDTDPDGTAAREVISLVRELVKLHEQESELRRAPGHAVAGG